MREITRAEVLGRWPRITAHLIAESLGYASPSLAAKIVADAAHRKPNFCEWILSCYGTDARRALEEAIRRRHRHQGYMATYPHALALVRRCAATDEEPLFASWF